VSDRWVINIDEKSYLVNIIEKGEEFLRLECDRKEFKIKSSWHHGEKLFRGVLDDLEIGVRIFDNNNTGSYLMQYSGNDAFVNVYSPRIAELSKFMPKIEKNPKPKNLLSPITGKIIRFKVKKGDKVQAGQELVVIEAMKMENSISTNHDFTIGEIKFNEGDSVGIGQVIMDFDNN